jgi:hypothetical protein
MKCPAAGEGDRYTGRRTGVQKPTFIFRGIVKMQICQNIEIHFFTLIKPLNIT